MMVAKKANSWFSSLIEIVCSNRSPDDAPRISTKYPLSDCLIDQEGSLLTRSVRTRLSRGKSLLLCQHMVSRLIFESGGGASAARLSRGIEYHLLSIQPTRSFVGHGLFQWPSARVGFRNARRRQNVARSHGHSQFTEVGHDTFHEQSFAFTQRVLVGLVLAGGY